MESLSSASKQEGERERSSMGAHLVVCDVQNYRAEAMLTRLCYRILYTLFEELVMATKAATDARQKLSPLA